MDAETTSGLDTTYRVVTPENIAFDYRLAGPTRRLVAFLLDQVIQGMIISFTALAFWLAAIVLTPALLGLYLIFLFVFQFSSAGVCEALWNGQTPGKFVMGLRVVTTNGLPIDGPQAMLRNLLRPMSVLFLIAMFGILGPLVLVLAVISVSCVLLTQRFQRIGDFAADTMVILDRTSGLKRLPQVPKDRDADWMDDLPASLPVTSGLSSALANYVARRKDLAPARRREVARYLAEPLRARYRVSEDIDPDRLLCGLYRKVFF